jgi:long-chain acyl-CoA synthetase
MERSTTVLKDRPWLSSYPVGVPANVEVPDEPVTAGLRRAAEQWPDRVAIDFLGAATTFADLDERIRKASGALRALGVQRGDRVALVMPNCTSHVVAFHAVLRLGAIAVEHNPTYTADELRHQLADSGATTALVWQHVVGTVVDAQDGTDLRRVVSVDVSRDLPRASRVALKLPVAKARQTREALTGAVPAGVPDFHRLVTKAAPLDVQPPASGDVALLQYTGGTTGTPKAAVLTHRNLVANVVQGFTWAGFRQGEETVYGILPFFHAFGLTFCLTLPGYIGATLVAFPQFDPASVVAAQRRRPATFLPGVAPMFDRVLDALDAAAKKPADGVRSIRVSFAGAMPISQATADRWEAATGGLLIEGYGMTEASPIALGNPCSDRRRPGTLGLPFPSTDIRVVSQDDPTVDVSAEDDETLRGELLLRGPQVFQGYWNRPEETEHQLLEGGWLRTGDVVVVEPDGWATLVDRVKEMIIVGGFKVYPSQVEDHLRTMPGVQDVAVVGLPTDDGEEVAAALVMETGAPTLDLAAVREWAEQRLPRYALPRSVHVLDDLPRSQIGKVLRRLVRDKILHRD